MVFISFLNFWELRWERPIFFQNVSATPMIPTLILFISFRTFASFSGIFKLRTFHVPILLQSLLIVSTRGLAFCTGPPEPVRLSHATFSVLFLKAIVVEKEFQNPCSPPTTEP